MSYSYGSDWAMDVLLFSQAANGTQFELPAAGVDVLGGMLAEGNARMEWAGEGTYFL